jgi:solute carrier family 50 protein (sugar transporter)
MDLSNIFGIIGVIISNILGIRIGTSYWKSRYELADEYNEYLFYLSFVTCVNWIYYSILISDIYIYTSCITTVVSTFGFIQILYNSVKISPFKLAIIEIGCIIILGLWLSLIWLQITNIVSQDLAIQIIGWNCSIISVIKNFSPFLITQQVITKMDPTLIYFPHVFLSFVNLSIWVAYSLIIGDMFQLVSNGLSALVCFIQLSVWVWIKCYKSNYIQTENLEQIPL